MHERISADRAGERWRIPADGSSARALRAGKSPHFRAVTLRSRWRAQRWHGKCNPCAGTVPDLQCLEMQRCSEIVESLFGVQ